MGLLAPIGCNMWSLTPYDKCGFRCLYCCMRVQGTSKPSVAPQLYPAAMRAALDDVPPDDLVILGAFNDAYLEMEEELGLARLAVDELIERGRRFVVCTKGSTVLRDADRFAAHRGRCKVYVSICSTDDDVAARLDPGAPLATERFRMIHELHARGVEVGLNALPWIPGVSDTAQLIERAPEGIEIIFGPLSVGNDREHMSLLGKRYGRDEINRLYMQEYQRFGHIPTTSWVRPTPPPGENDPMHRLPVLAPSGAARPRSFVSRGFDAGSRLWGSLYSWVQFAPPERDVRFGQQDRP